MRDLPSPNRAHSSRWQITTGDIPYKFEDGKPWHQLVDQFVKDGTPSGFNANTIISNRHSYEVDHPNSDRNKGGYEFEINYFADELFLNYYYHLSYFEMCQFGLFDPAELALVDQVLDFAKFGFLDNQKRPVFDLIYRECVLISLSELQPTAGSSNAMTFTTKWKAPYFETKRHPYVVGGMLAP